MKRTLVYMALWMPLIAAVPVAAQVSFTKVVLDTDFPANQQPFTLEVADMDGDAILDLVVNADDPISGKDALYWYHQDGNQQFTRFPFDTTLSLTGGLDVADVDGDLDVDVVQGLQGGVALYTNEAGAGFVKQMLDNRLSAIRFPLVSDLDDDDDDDIIVLSTFGLFWLVNEGVEGFRRDTIEVVPIRNNILDVVDLDDDTDLDIVSRICTPSGPQACENTLVWYRNDGDASFARQTLDAQHQLSVTSLVVDDLDEDGDKDVITAEFENNAVLWYRNDGSEHFTRDTISVAFDHAPRRVAVADIDDDGDRDVLATGGNSARGEVVYFENDGSEHFTKRTIDDSEGNRYSLVAVDVDADGDVDLLVTNQFPFEVLLYRNDGATGVRNASDVAVPDAFSLAQNYPNPFNPATTISFELPRAQHVVLQVYDVLGREVAVLVDGVRAAGAHAVRFEAVGLPAGVYLYRMDAEAGAAVTSRRMVLLK